MWWTMIFVLVHGAYHGGWCWRDLKPLLEAAGQRVYTPTLTGLGERAHLARPEVGLETHVEDILALYRYEDLSDTLLVGHSYGGLVVGMVADRMPERINTLIYLDALVPEDGVSLVDLQAPERVEGWRQAAKASGGWLIPPPSSAFYGVTDPALQAWADARCTPQPWRSVFDKAVITGRTGQVGKTVYIRCLLHTLDYMERFAEQARSAPCLPDAQVDPRPTGQGTVPNTLSLRLSTT